MVFPVYICVGVQESFLYIPFSVCRHEKNIRSTEKSFYRREYVKWLSVVNFFVNPNFLRHKILKILWNFHLEVVKKTINRIILFCKYIASHQRFSLLFFVIFTSYISRTKLKKKAT